MTFPPAACVDVVIPTYRAAGLVERCVEHLVDETIAARIVVDDASGDDTVARLSGAPGVEVVALDRQRGLSHAFNRGAERGAAPLLLFLNNDIFPAAGAIDLLVADLLSNEAAASAAGRLVDEETQRTQPSYQPRVIAGPAAVAARLIGIERHWPGNPLTGQHLRHPLSEIEPTVTSRQPAGACLLVRRSDHERLGGWDERYWMWYEDVDYSRRLVQLGPAVYDPRARFRHVGGASTKHWAKPEQHRSLYRGALQYAAIHFGPAGRAVVGFTAMLVTLPRIARYRHRDPPAAEIYRSIARGGYALLRGRRIRSAGA